MVKVQKFLADKKARTNKTPESHLFFNYNQDIASDQASNHKNLQLKIQEIFFEKAKILQSNN
uniref:Uncharacterized protein n=1 Tax=Romanomermis culicivorax TaxID=13658 RepID=A0A915KB89_ROMCU